MGIYATVEDLQAYAVELADRDDPELEEVISKAEGDIDAYAGAYPINEDDGRKFILDDLDAQVSAQITRATCAQARYRIYMGPVFFIEQQQYREVSGDISSSRASRYGPEMKQEFPDGIRKLTGRLSGGNTT